MKTLKNENVTLALDERFPRVLWYDDAATGTRIVGDPENVPPRVYLFRQSDRATLTSDDAPVQVCYTLAAGAADATYRALVQCDGKAAVEFDLAITLSGPDLLVRMQNVREHEGYCFFSVRLAHLASAMAAEKDSRLVTCSWQGRVLDPGKCQPMLVDYSWVGFTARSCGAIYRADFMVTLDLPGYEDLLIEEVRQVSRVGDGVTLAGLGAEVMYRQRMVEGPWNEIKVFPPKEKCPKVVPPPKPILCAEQKDIRLHFISAPAGAKLDWTAAARYFQSFVPAEIKPHPLYDVALVYKICMAHRHRPYMSFEQALDIVRQVHDVTGGMKQVCYLAYFQYDGGETGYPAMWEIYPPLGDKAALRRVMEEGRKYNAIVSFHQNLDVFDTAGEAFDGAFVNRDTLGRMASAGYWHPTQLLPISMPAYREQFRKHIARLVSEYGIAQTYHLDTFSGGPYTYDAHPKRPFSAQRFQEGKFEILKMFNAHGIDVTSENLTDAYVGKIGHTWALFNWGTFWQGEEAVPFANFIYHGATSWNSGNAKDTQAILNSLIQAGGAGIEFPIGQFIPAEARLDVIPTPWPELLDNLYLVHWPYMLLRDRKWAGMTTAGSKRRVDYCETSPAKGPSSPAGKGSFIEVDDGRPGYKVVVDGQTIARDFVTMVPAPDGSGAIAYARQDTDMDWQAPAGWKDGPVCGLTLTPAGPGVRVEARVAGGRLKLKLQAHQPVRLTT